MKVENTNAEDAGQVSKKLIDIYRNRLSPDLQRIVQILAVHVFPMRQMDLIDCLDGLGIRSSSGKRFSHRSIQPVIKDLAGFGVIHKEPKGVFCNKDIRNPAVTDAVLSKKFSAIASTLEYLMSFDDAYIRMFEKDVNGFYRCLQFSLFHHGDPDEVFRVWQSGQTYLTVAFFDDLPMLSLFNRPFNFELVKILGDELQRVVLLLMSAEAEVFLEPCRELMDYALEFYCSTPGMEPEKARFMGSLLLCGRFKEYNDLLQTFPENSYAHLMFQGCYCLIRDENKTALSWFHKGLAVMKKNNRKRKIFPVGFTGLMFLFALLKTRDPDQYETALIYIETALKTQGIFSGCFQGMRPLFRTFQPESQEDEQEQGWFDECPNQNLTIQFFLILIMTWQNPDKAQHLTGRIQNIYKQSVKAGYLWLAAESALILAHFGEASQVNREYGGSAHKTWGTASLVHMLPRIPEWQNILTALTMIGDRNKSGPKDKAKNSDQRMVWLLTYLENLQSAQIAPRLQKLNKKGAWTKGRAVAMKKLYQDFTSMDWLTDQDKQICRAIEEYSYRTGYSSGYYNYTQTEYQFDVDKALTALVGHPLVYADAAVEMPVEIFEAEPEIRLKTQKGNLRMTMSPRPKFNGNSTILIRETPTRFKLVRFSEYHQMIAGLLGEKGLELPKTAQKSAVRTAASLASLVQVNSDLPIPGSEQAKIVLADPTPHVHIMPFQNGISAEFRVRPFTDTGSYFKPGRGGTHVFAQKEGEKLTAQRDLVKEKALADELTAQCPSLEYLSPVDDQWQAGEPEQALELLHDLKSCEDRVVLEWPKGEKLKIASRASFNHLYLKIEKDREWFKAAGSLELDNGLSLDLKKLMEMLTRSTGRFLPLDDGTFISLTRALKERLEELKSYGVPHGKGVRIAPLAGPAVAELVDQAGHLETDKAWKAHCKKLGDTVSPQVPGTLQARLRDYQKTGFQWLAQLVHWEVGGCLADDMGLGKTLQALSAILLTADQGPALVVAPLSVMANWQEECKRFAPTLNPKIFGPGDRGKFLDSLEPFDLVIASYGLLQNEEDRLSKVSWQTIVLDEAQAIKNMKTKRSRAAMKLSARFKLITTGTPVENHLDELWTLFNFINPGLLGNFKRFKEQLALPIERDQDKKASQRLRKLIRPFILRRLKTDVLKELPEKTEVTLYVEMNPDEAALYEAQRLKSIENIETAGDETGARHFRILAELTRLRRLCCNPSLILPEAGIKSSKLKVFSDTVDELLENRHKALVFSQFVGHLDILKGVLDKRNISYQYLDGSTPAKERQKRINAFQSGQGELFLISLKAGGAGLNLTAADYVIHMDPWWNPAVEDQASDRAHRIGQTRPVTVYRLVIKDSIEEKIIALHQEKRDLAENLLAGSDAAGRISADELLELLKK